MANDEREHELFHRIKAAGIPVAKPTEEQKLPSVLISQDFESYGSEIFDFSGGTGIVLPLKIDL